jgi:hypothetical protein
VSDPTPRTTERALLTADIEALDRLHDKVGWMERTYGELFKRIEAGELVIEVLTPSAHLYTNARGAFHIYGTDQHGGPIAEHYIIRLQALAARVSAVERAHRCDMSRWTPVDMTLVCPSCGRRHVDVGEWATRPHKTHRCVDGPDGIGCSNEWRPFDYPTVGV